MNSSAFGRSVMSVRKVFNRIDLRVYAAGLAAVTFLLLWTILASAYLPSRLELEPGEVARDLVRAPRQITFENHAETERQRVQAAESVPNVFSFDPEVLPRVLQNIDQFFNDLAAVMAQERAAAEGEGRPYDPVAAARRAISQADQELVPEITVITLARLSSEQLEQVRQAVLASTQRILEGNVTNTSIAMDRDRLAALVQTMPLSDAERSAATAVGGAFLEPNNIINGELTEQARERAASDVQPVMVTILSGETIVSPGRVVTEENVAALKALGLTEQGRKYGAILGLGLLSLVQILVASLYIRRFEKKIRISRALLFITASLLIIFVAMTRVSAIEPLSPLLVPIAALGMLGTFILSTRMSLILVVLTCANLAVVAGTEPQYIIVALMGGVAGTFLVTNVFQRRDLARAGLVSGIVIVASAVGAGQLGESSLSGVASTVAWGSGNALLVLLIAGGLLTFYEMIFNLPTPLKLLELADPTRPLLKELMMKAPGTYNHSIIMGNIAETAAQAIGANPLIARTAAYYHDIGKLNRPDYFIENQFHVKNPHDRLTPGLSRLAITAHVKDGVQLAQEEGLPPEIVDIIKEHHGTTVLSYFYQKARDEARGGHIDEESYRYAGHKPTSREAAIVMLADSVEAAVRALENPTVRNIQTVIREIFDQRLHDGQLSESEMTLSDLDKVRRVFEKSLQGFGSRRIAYPSSGEKKPGGPRPARERPERKAGTGK